MSSVNPILPKTRSDSSEMIVSGRISSAVWHIAWPTVVNTLILNAYNVINGIFLGMLPHSRDPLAAAGVGGAALMMQFSMVMGLTAGTGALVSQFLGAEKNDDANEATRQSLLLSAIIGGISAIPLIVWALPLVKFIGTAGAVSPLAADYVAIISYFAAPTFIYMIALTALRSAGDMKSALYAGVAIIGVNTLLDWLLIIGPGPFPQMGIQGAAWATGISRVFAVGVTLWFLKRSVLRDSILHFKPHTELMRKIFQIGWPAMLTNFAWTLAYTIFVKFLSFLPGGAVVVTNVQAALTVGMRIESLSFMPGLAYSQAATPLVGQNLGAGKPDRATRCAWIATLHAVLIMGAFGIVFLVIPGQLAHAFTRDASVVTSVVWYLRINAISEPFLAANMVLRGALQGAGDNMMPAIITLFTNYAVRLPLAWFLAIHLNYGVKGAWAAMSLSTIMSGILMITWFQMGRWRNRHIIEHIPLPIE